MARERTKHEGVYRRPSTDGRDECFDITYKLPHPERPGEWLKRWEKVGWKSEGYSAKLASEIRAERMRQIRHGDVPAVRSTLPKTPPAPEATVADSWRNYLADHLSTLHSNIKPDLARWTNHLAPRWGDSPLSSITFEDLKLWRNSLEEKGLSPQTVEHCLTLLRRIVNFALDMGHWRGVSPFPRSRRQRRSLFPTVANERWRWLTPAEARELLDEMRRRSLTWHAVCLFSLHTGCRFGEIAALTGDRLDLDRMNGRVIDTKSGEDRTIYLTPTLSKTLRNFRIRPGALVFPSRTGGVVRQVSESFVRAVDRLGLNAGIDDNRARVVFHTWRHTYGSWLAMAGVPIYRIANLMGHGDQETTQRYAHLCPRTQAEASLNIEKWFSGHGAPGSAPPSSVEDATPETLAGLFAGTG